MNEILKKATEELAKESPDIAYVRGMLETLLAMNTKEDSHTFKIHESGDSQKGITSKMTEVNGVITDEGAILDAQTRALLGKIPPPVEEMI